MSRHIRLRTLALRHTRHRMRLRKEFCVRRKAALVEAEEAAKEPAPRITIRRFTILAAAGTNLAVEVAETNLPVEAEAEIREGEANRSRLPHRKSSTKKSF
jgi:hypothetical protein